MKKYKIEIEVELDAPEDKPCEWIYEAIQEQLVDKEMITLFKYIQEETNESID